MNVSAKHRRSATGSAVRRGTPIRWESRSAAKRRLTPTNRVVHLREAERPRIDAIPPVEAPAPVHHRLSPLDRMFLALESPSTPMHIGALLLFEPRTASERFDIEGARRHLEARLALVPRYRQRLARAALTGDLFWVDDADFRIARHVKRAALPRPGDLAALGRVSSRLLSQRVDVERPLWEMHLIDGLGDRRFALVSKTHHCLADGMAGAELLALLLSPDPQEGPASGAPWTAAPPPAPLELLRARLGEALGATASAAQELGRGWAGPPSLRSAWQEYGAPVWQTLLAGARPAPPTPLNVPIGSSRRFAGLQVELSDVKAVKDRVGATVNDVVLAVVAGAIRRFFKHRDPAVKLADLRALVPVNVRTAAQRGALGNRISAWLMPLPVQDWDPVHRLATVQATSAELKASHAVRGGQVLTAGSAMLLQLGMQLVKQIRPFNVVVTNVPGPPFPLYLLGARLQSIYPQTPLFPNQGLGVALFSYDGHLFWGFNADANVVPDLDDFVTAVKESFADLMEAVLAPRIAGARRPRRLDAERLHAAGRTSFFAFESVGAAGRRHVEPPAASA